MAISQFIDLTLYDQLMIAPVVEQFHLNYIYLLNPDYMKTATTGTGTVSSSDSIAFVQTGASSSSSAVLQSLQRIRYIPGQSNNAVFSILLSDGVDGSTQYAGVGDELNGFFIGFNNTEFGVLHRQNGVEHWFPAYQWPDKLDGNGASSFTLRHTQGNVFKIQWQWLGFGNVKFYVRNPNTSRFFVIYELQYVNAHDTVTLTYPALPLRLEVSNTTNTSNLSLRNGSFGAYTEGFPSTVALRNSYGTSTTIAPGSEQAVVTLRNNGTINGLPNTLTAYPDQLSVSNTSAQEVLFKLVGNATLGGTPSFTPIDATRSFIDYDTDGTTVTGGKEYGRWYCARFSCLAISLPGKPFMSLLADSTLTVSGLTFDGMAPISAGIGWREEW